MSHPQPGTPCVRFAPSPTGHLHIGGVRTALFNYFYAKNQNGKFVLRIEDTDISRSSSQMAHEIIRGLEWLGLHWDDGPCYQSQRFELYRKTAYQLLEKKLAYPCFCSPEEIEARRNQKQKDQGENIDKSQLIYKYDRKCLTLSQQQIDKHFADNIPFVIRFHVPDGVTYFKDRIHKEMKSDNSQLEDFVLLKSDKTPTYHLSVVVDDHEMGIDNVIRGDDHISNTFKQVLLFKALDRKPPKYAHLPLILGADKKKLSKRHGETSILEFKRNGYLPEALINYLSQLSWIPADTKKIFSMEELIRQFALSKMSKNSPVFDYEKLRFINGRAIQQKDPAHIYQILIQDSRFNQAFQHIPEDRKIELIRLVKPRMKTLNEFYRKFEFYLADELDYKRDPKELEKLNQSYPTDTIIRHLKLIFPRLEKIETFDRTTVENSVRECAEANRLKAADFIHPARYALTSETVSPSLFEVFEFMGKTRSVRRIRSFINWLETNQNR